MDAGEAEIGGNAGPCPPLDDRSHEVLVALRRIIRATDLHSKQLVKSTGLTIPQVMVLRSVRQLGEVTIGEIARHVSLSQGTVTTILDRLENRGLVERYRSRADRRVVHLHLTDAGQAVLGAAPALLHDRFVAAFTALEPTRQEQIIATLKQVAEMMGAEGLDAAPMLVIAEPVTSA